MSVDVVIGAQFGSEGKGKICAYLGVVGDYTGAIRTGGPNAAHTVIQDNRRYVFRHIPSASVNRSLELVIGPGSHLRPDVLTDEIRDAGDLGIAHRLSIDRLAGIITPDHIRRNAILRTPTTGQGTSLAIADRALRNLTCVRDVPLPHGTVVDVARWLAPRLSRENFLLEGTQGFGLGFYQDWYPRSTSRDISVAALLSEGALPRDCVRDVYGVFRTFPIRTTDGESDLGAGETSWKSISRLAGATNPIVERGTLDGTVRRVARFSKLLTERFILLNRPTFACLTFVDYLDVRARGVTKLDELPGRARRFIDFIEDSFELRVGLISTGPGTFDTVDLRQ
ncbi:MAG: adenylosuccinate synthetase [Candidatus Accumulibacter similis]|nr:MAG: adenylosuccinate synthetase [Candidatus Accumulibacter similis]